MVEHQVHRQGFDPYVAGLDALTDGGIPLGFWTVLYGPPGAYKTLHALAWCLAGLAKGERCVYVSTEMEREQLEQQLASLGWDTSRYHTVYFTNRILEDQDYGNYQFVLVDLDSLYWWARKLNRLFVGKVKEGGETRVKRFWYDDPDLLAHAVIVALGAVGVIERKSAEITVEEARFARLREGLSRRQDRRFTVNRDVVARVVIDSISPFITGRYAVAGKIMTGLKVRLSLPNVSYMVVSHVARTTEEELGAEIGHVADARIKLWMELDTTTRETRYYGWIAKMRATNHSRRVHAVELARHGKRATLYWKPL